MKVFVTVGSMLPFDRLVQAMDAWAKMNAHAQVFAQIGETGWRPSHIDFRSFITPSEFRQRFVSCDVVVAHVGMGTVITAFEYRKPVIMLPRRRELAEVTSNHQMATAKWLDGWPGIRIVYSEHDLTDALSRDAGREGAPRFETGTKANLIGALRQFISD